MCTLSFIPTGTGYLLAMNRDERLARGPASAPALTNRNGVQALYPRDIEGGTWIAVNDQGIAFALLNWNDVPIKIAKSRSRGELIPAMIAATHNEDARLKFESAKLDGVLPFRLIGMFPAEGKISEWRWDCSTLQHQRLTWDARHWFSSSLSDEEASLRRGAACEKAWEEEDAGSVNWIRRLHRSHGMAVGPFSICVHREEVETISYTEIVCSAQKVSCEYAPGTPCTMQRLEYSVELERK
jgi:hypothetical protein